MSCIDGDITFFATVDHLAKAKYLLFMEDLLTQLWNNALKCCPFFCNAQLNLLFLVVPKGPLSIFPNINPFEIDSWKMFVPPRKCYQMADERGGGGEVAVSEAFQGNKNHRRDAGTQFMITQLSEWI